jgi:hypothetical protein
MQELQRAAALRERAALPMPQPGIFGRFSRPWNRQEWSSSTRANYAAPGSGYAIRSSPRRSPAWPGQTARILRGAVRPGLSVNSLQAKRMPRSSRS